MSELPNTWETGTLGELCDFNPRHRSDTPRTLEVTFLPMPAVDDGQGVIASPQTRPLSDVWQGYTHIAEGDVIFAKITPCMENGKIAIATSLLNGLACGSTEFHVLRSKGALQAAYLWRYLRQQSFRKIAESHMTGAVGQRRVPKQFLEQTSIPIAPAAEQQRIVTKINSLVTKSARAREELLRIDNLATRFKDKLLEKAFSGELLGGPVSDWAQYTLSEVAKVGTGATPKKDNPKYYDGGSIPWVTSGAINQRYINKASDFITPLALKETNCKVYPPGTILMAMYGEGQTRGRVAALSIAAATNQALAAIEVNDTSLSSPAFVKLYLESRYLVFRKLASGGVQPNLNLNIIKNFKIPLPSLQVQREIVNRIEAAFSKMERVSAEGRRALELTDRLDEAVLAKAFKGELVPQDPNDEPASVLLERMRAERQKLEARPQNKRSQRKAREDSTFPPKTAEFTEGLRRMEKTRVNVPRDHLARLLKAHGNMLPEALWRQSEMVIDEFYKQLRLEMDASIVRIGAENELEAA
ncbi:restriction endonuclease subunit S [Sinorhizobium meliloti]|uniref:restriction endonuclease subunit S n=1 Tax=Rhizobium meliloti TaxID=382 RepID=UPI00398D19CD